jgi:hypothetical protein
MLSIARPSYLLTPFPASTKMMITGVCQITASGHILAAGVATPYGELVAFRAVGTKGISSTPGNPIGELIVTALPNRLFGEGNIIGELIATGQNVPHAATGGAIDILQNSILVKASASHIDIRGADALATLDGDGVIIWHPPPAYASFYNSAGGSTNAIVPDITTSARLVTAPTVEGTPFYTGGAIPWGGDGTTHPCTRTSPLTWSTPQACSFIDITTTFLVQISNSTGVVETYTTPAITGNGIYAAGNISVTVSGWIADSDKFRAVVSVTVVIDNIFPNSGYFDILIQHNDGADGTFTKTQ